MLGKMPNGSRTRSFLKRVGLVAVAQVAAAGFIAVSLLVGCSSDTPAPTGNLKCGAGTHEVKGECLPDVKSTTVVQAGKLEPSPTPPKPADEQSWRLGVTTFATYDSSGEPAWDASKSPLVFITTTGPGYGGMVSTKVKNSGLSVIDAQTHEVLKYVSFDLGAKSAFEPHGLGVSEDGRWIYLPAGDTGSTPNTYQYLIIDAKTLKLNKILALRGRGHHSKSFVDSKGNPRSLLYGWEQPPFVLDPKDDNKLVGGADMNATGMEGYLWFATPDGKELWGSGRWRLGSIMAAAHANQVMVVDTETWKLKEAIPFEGESTPIWIEFTPDNQYAYVSGGHSSTIIKWDRVAKKQVGLARAGVEGPYGIRLNWDGTELYAVGKGEGSHNLGKELGVVDTKLMESSSRPKDQYLTDCVRGDHATLHPDPAKNELWLSCNSSFEIAIFSMTDKKVIARIPMPDGGSTHSGSFVKYKPDYTGEVLSDQNGLHGSARQEQLSRLKK